MNDARYSMTHDLQKSLSHHYAASSEHHHMDGIMPTSMAHVVDLIKKGHFEHADNEKAMNEHIRYGDALHMFRFREHKADTDGHEATVKKIDEAYRDAKLKVAVLPEAEALKHVEDFRKKTFH